MFFFIKNLKNNHKTSPESQASSFFEAPAGAAGANVRAARWLAEIGFGEVLTTAFVRGDGLMDYFGPCKGW